MNRLMISLLVLLMAGCPYNRPPWHIVGREIDGWQKAVDEVKSESPCHLPSGFYGGIIEVRDSWGIYPCYPTPVDGCVMGSDHIIVAWADLVEHSAIPEELCHIVIAHCTRDHAEPPARACKDRVNARIVKWRADK